MGNYKKQYDELKTTPEAIAEEVRSGWVCGSDIALSLPPAIMKAFDEKVKTGQLTDIQYHTMLEWFPFSAYEKEFPGVTGTSWFSNNFARGAVNEGLADVMPAYFRDLPSLIAIQERLDAIFLTVSPMDEDGYFSTGTSASLSEALLKKADRIYLEVNHYFPSSVHGPKIHISDVDSLCENHAELPDVPRPKLDDISKQIASYIVEEVPNEANIQFGIGAIPDAVGSALQDKRDLGIHTEMFTGSMVDLIEKGVVTNHRKPLHQGKTVASFAFGSRRVYDAIHENEDVMMLPIQQVNDPSIIRSMPNFISVNSAVEIDFFGQVSAESIGTTHFSGTGGQVDFVRGSILSPGGKSFLAFPSTAKNGEVSRIKSVLSPGSIVTTSKNDVNYVVTEYGIANLRGKTLRERTKELIRLAHPKFREALTFDAKKRNIIV